MKTLDRLSRNLSDLCGLFFVPLLLALLPWRIAFPLLGRIARGKTFHREAEAAFAAAKPHLRKANEEDWKQRYKLIRWIERIDLYLVLLHGSDWWMARIDFDGAWPATDRRNALLTFHWGAGSWIWKLLRAHDLETYFVARGSAFGDFGLSTVSIWYGRLRGWSLSRIGSLGPIYTGGSTGQIEKAFAADRNILCMLDVPPTDLRWTCAAEVLGRRILLPTKFLHLARSATASFSIVSCGFDFRTGRRQLRIEILNADSDESAVLKRYAERLNDLIEQDPALWMMWHEWPAMQRRGTEP